MDTLSLIRFKFSYIMKNSEMVKCFEGLCSLNYVPKALHFLLLSNFTISIKQTANDETYVDFNINWNAWLFISKCYKIFQKNIFECHVELFYFNRRKPRFWMDVIRPSTTDDDQNDAVQETEITFKLQVKRTQRTGGQWWCITQVFCPPHVIVEILDRCY